MGSLGNDPDDDEDYARVWVSSSTRRRLRLALGAVLGVVLVVAGVVGFRMAWSPIVEGESPDDQSTAELVACARIIVVGTVRSVSEPDSKDRVRVKVAVEEWVKPARGRPAVSLTTRDPAADDRDPWVRGQRTLAVVPANGRLAPHLYTGRRPVRLMRRDLVDALLRRGATACPAYWRTTGPR